jgi:uncharacterized protein (DUF849 family)
MVAPNGARKTRLDHPALPVSIAQTVEEAVQCHAAGATVLHAHVRGSEDEHLLDAGLYQELIAEMKRQAPTMLVQITTEAVGRYTPQQQVDCVESVVPEMASVSLREMTCDFKDPGFAKNFFHWAAEAEVHIQHIVYSAEELATYMTLRQDGIIPASQRCVLFVLGRYAVDFQSSPADLELFLNNDLTGLDWFVCAFGAQEQSCVIAGIDQGGHARIGFENNLHLPDGSIASSSAELVAELAKSIKAGGHSIAGAEQTRQLLGIRRA